MVVSGKVVIVYHMDLDVDGVAAALEICRAYVNWRCTSSTCRELPQIVGKVQTYRDMVGDATQGRQLNMTFCYMS